MKLALSIRYGVISLFLLLSHPQFVTSQVVGPTPDVPIQIRLKAEKDTIMLGEPLFIAFEVTNLSGEKLCLGVGGDYRNKFGRPDSFKVTVRNANGAELPQIEVSGTGGFIGCGSMESGETYTVRLFLSHWTNIERTGTYQINVKRVLGFSNYEASGSGRRNYSMQADVNAEFVVVPYDENKMGGIISSLGSIMLDLSDPRAAESAQALASIRDKRVITYFAETLRTLADSERDWDFNELGIKSRAIAVLATYDDDRAIQALQEAMDSPSDDTRLNVADALGDSPHKSAMKLLLKMQDDRDADVRRIVAYGLVKNNSRESLAALQKLLKDQNEDVRNAAQQSMNKISH